MAYNTFGPGIALDKVTMRGLPAQPARIIDAETGDVVQAFTLGPNPQPVVLSTNVWGYFPQFQTMDGHRRVQITFGRLMLELIAFELITAAADAVLQSAQDAEASRIAAELAAGLVGAPADLAIAAAVSAPTSQTRAALDALYTRGGVIDGASHGITPGATGLAGKLQALSAANPGRSIYLGEGLYNFLAPVPLRGGIVGAGPQTILRFAEIGYAALWTNGDNDVQFRNFSLVSLGADTELTQASSHGIILEDALNFHIENVWVTGKFVMGIQVRSSTRGTISNNMVTGTTYDGIHCTLGCSDITISGNHMVNTGDDAIALITYNTDPAANRRITVTGNTINGVGHARGVTVEGCIDAVVSANVIQGTNRHGILISSISPSDADVYPTINCLVVGNIIRTPGQDAIRLDGRNEGVVIRGNIITKSAFQAIHVLKGCAIIEDNVIDDADQNGIVVVGLPHNNFTRVTGNTIRRPGHRGILNEASDVTISDNVIERPATIAANADGIMSAAGDRIMITNNRIIGISAAKTGNAIWLDGCDGAIVADNYATNVGNTFGQVNCVNVETAVESVGALIRAADRANGIFNVKDYGAFGNGTTDDTAAVQAAATALKTAGGGKLFFPRGDYYIRNIVWISSNIEIYGDGATIRKKFSTDPSYVVFAGSSGSNPGYAQGANDVYVHDLKFRGKFGTGGRHLCVLALHHSDRVTVERIDVEEASGGGHRIDLQGCRYVTVRDSVFRGFEVMAGLAHNEDIQADYSTRRSGSFVETDVNSYDGQPSMFVTVENCTWLPLFVGATEHHAANPFGTHGAVLGSWISDISFINNTVLYPVPDPGSIVPGALHFLAVRNLKVEGNQILGLYASMSPAIACYQATGGQDPTKVKTTDPSISFPTPMRCENVSIKNNRISGFHASDSVVRVAGSDASRCFDVVITGNYLFETSPSNGNNNDGPLPFILDYCQRVIFNGNTTRQSRRLAQMTNCSDVTIQSNVCQGIPTNNLTLGDCQRVSVIGNSFLDVISFAIYCYGSNGLAIQGNTMSCIGSGPGIRVGDAAQFSVANNILMGFGAGLGIEITGGSAGVVIGNSVGGFTTPLSPAATTGNIQVGWNSAV